MTREKPLLNTQQSDVQNAKQRNNTKSRNGKYHLTYRGRSIRIMLDFLSTVLKAGKQGMTNSNPRKQIIIKQGCSSLQSYLLQNIQRKNISREVKVKEVEDN